MEFKNKTVIITGSSSGIGAETALLFARHGANVVINYLNNKKGADSVMSKIKELGSNALCIKADVSNEGDCKMLVSKVINTFNSIDILVNNVGAYFDKDEWCGDVDSWNKTFNTNIISALLMSKYVAEHFVKNKNGKIVNISSRLGINGSFDSIAYSASKAAIINITKSYAKLLSPFGTANCVLPGATYAGYWIKTATKKELTDAENSNPHKKLVETIDIANAVLFLASSKAKMITNQNILVDGGATSLAT